MTIMSKGQYKDSVRMCTFSLAGVVLMFLLLFN